MSWDKWDIATLGRVAGLTIIVVGVVLATWELSGYPDGLPTDDRVRFFLRSVLSWGASGMFVIMAAEIAHRVGRREEWDEDNGWEGLDAEDEQGQATEDGEQENPDSIT